MKYVILFTFIAFAFAEDYSERKDYLESENKLQNGYQKIMQTIKNASNEANNLSTNFAMLLNAVLKLAENYRLNPSLYEDDFLSTSVNAMSEVEHDAQGLKKYLKSSYHNITNTYILTIDGLIKDHCNPNDLFQCNDIIQKYYDEVVPTLPEEEKKKLELARDVLFSSSDALEALLKPVPPQIDILKLSAKSQPVLAFVEVPDDVLPLVKIVEYALFNIHGKVFT